jgi:hypothetical protein
VATQTFDTRIKDPADVLDYLIDWQAGAKPFLSEDEVITTSSWTAYDDKWAATDDLVIDSDSHTDTTATGWVSGGLAGQKYYITNHVVTDQGREKDLSIKIDCKEQ